MAPPLIEYIEKSNVYAGTQLAATVLTSVVTAMMEPEVCYNITASARINTLQDGAAHPLSDFVGNNTSYESAVSEILGETSATNITNSLKSADVSGTKSISITLSSNSSMVIIANSDSRGSKGQNSWSATDQIGVY